MCPPSKEHDRESVHAYVCEDLRRAKIAPFYTWTKAVLGLSLKEFLSRAHRISQLRWFEDAIVQAALVDFARAKTEGGRYDPFVHLSNRLIELARGALPGIGKKYPIDNFCFAKNATRTVQPIPEHGALAARRRPDILGLSKPDACNLYRDGGYVVWPAIYTWVELKGRLYEMMIAALNNQRQKRGLPSLDDAGIPINQPKGKSLPARDGLFADKPNTSRQRTKSTLNKIKVKESKAATRKTSVKVGQKRLPEEDLLENIDKTSSAKRRNSAGTSAQVYDNATAVIQSSSYALELLAGTYGTRIHCFGFVLKNDRIFLWYYDASGVAYTQEFVSMIDDFEVFAALIIGIACCTTEQFGVMPSTILKAPSRSFTTHAPLSLEKYTIVMAHPRSKKDVVVILGNPIFTQYSLMGRRTFLYAIKTKPGVTAKPLIAKFSYQACTRRAEQDLVAIARRAGVKHLPHIHMWAELWRLSDGVRRIFQEDSAGSVPYEDRTLRAIVYTQYTPIKRLFAQSPLLIPVMVIQMIDCLHDLRYKANMLHRDISVNNIMYQMRNGRHHFVLIDFDMAIVLPTAAAGSLLASSSHRTGTLPFMACELISDASLSNAENWKPIPHALRHDYESLFWVALWCILVLVTEGLPEQRIEKHGQIVREWQKGTLSQISGTKIDLCTKELNASGITLPPAALPLGEWFTAWGMLILQASGAIRLLAFKGGNPNSKDGSINESWETADGIFTRDNLKTVLMAAYPIPPAAHESNEPYDSDTDDDDLSSVGALAQKSSSQSAMIKIVRRSTRVNKAKPTKSKVPSIVENNIRSRLRPRRPQN